MNVGLYERIWMWAAGLIIALFLVMTGVSAALTGVRPPSHVEVIDPGAVMTDPRFARQGVITLPDGRVQATIVVGMFFWLPSEIHVPAGRPVTFRLTSIDVTHGFEIAKTNVNTMVVPGYVSQLTYTFDTPGEYLLVCNEYCGTGHHTMGGKVIVEARP